MTETEYIFDIVETKVVEYVCFECGSCVRVDEDNKTIPVCCSTLMEKREYQNPYLLKTKGE